MPVSGEYLTAKEAANELQITLSALHAALQEGRLSFTVAYGRKVIARADLEAYRQRTRPDGEKPKGRPRKAA